MVLPTARVVAVVCVLHACLVGVACPSEVRPVGRTATSETGIAVASRSSGRASAHALFLETRAGDAVRASPDDDLEAEISYLDVAIRARPGSCLAEGTQLMTYRFANGEFDTLEAQIGDDTVGIEFYTKRITLFNSTDYPSCSAKKPLQENVSALTCMQTRKRSTTKCLSEIEWEFPKIIASDAKPKSKHFRIDFDVEMGTVVNETHKYNELVFSTGFHYRLAVKRTRIQFMLPKKFDEKLIVMMGNSQTTGAHGATYNAKTGVVTFERDYYLAPMNRYTARVWFPMQRNTKSCTPCQRVEDWAMLVILLPFVLCFVIPCCLHLYGKDKPTSPRDRGGGFEGTSFEDSEGRVLGTADGGAVASERQAFCGCCCERDEDDDTVPPERRDMDAEDGVTAPLL